MKRDDLPLLAVVAVVVAFYVGRIAGVESELGNPTAREAYYNRLVEGFRAGQLHLPIAVPDGLQQLADPYDPAANQPYRGEVFAPNRLHDTSYYRGKIYLYFGVTPALLLFWPWHVVTGGYVSHAVAAVVFCIVGFLASVALLRAAWRRYFPAVGAGMVTGGGLALGMATSVPAMLWRPDVWEVPIACGYALSMLALLALWRAFHASENKARWLALASVLYGLAIGARPSLLWGAPILLLPLLPAFRVAAESRRAPQWIREVLATVLPIAAIGVGLALYNYARFGHPMEFGQTYQLADDRQDRVEHFSARYLGYNARLYFWQPARWTTETPLRPEVSIPPAPAGHGAIDRPNGMLINTPLIALALLFPFAWRRLNSAALAGLRGVMLSVAILFAASALTLGLFYGTCVRYQVEFQPALVLLAVLMVFALQQHWVAQTHLRRAVGAAWVALLTASVAFSVLRDRDYPAQVDHLRGTALLSRGQAGAAIPFYEKAIARKPGLIDAHEKLGVALLQTNRVAEAAQRFEQGLKLAPDNAELHVDLGGALWQLKREAEGIDHFRRALNVEPNSVEARFALSNALRATGRLDEARQHYLEARRLRPELPPLDF